KIDKARSDGRGRRRLRGGRRTSQVFCDVLPHVVLKVRFDLVRDLLSHVVLEVLADMVSKARADGGLARGDLSPGLSAARRRGGLWGLRRSSGRGAPRGAGPGAGGRARFRRGGGRGRRLAQGLLLPDFLDKDVDFLLELVVARTGRSARAIGHGR